MSPAATLAHSFNPTNTPSTRQLIFILPPWHALPCHLCSRRLFWMWVHTRLCAEKTARWIRHARKTALLFEMGNCMVCVALLTRPWRIGQRWIAAPGGHWNWSRCATMNRTIRAQRWFVLATEQGFAKRESWRKIALQTRCVSLTVSLFGRLQPDLRWQLPVWSIWFM